MDRYAHIAPTKEETHLFHDFTNMLTNILLSLWSDGHDIYVDISVVSPFISVGPNHISGATSQVVEKCKFVKYERCCEEQNILFMLFILDKTVGFNTKMEPLL